jgi:CRISPR/Cas system-associated protein Csm6
VSKLDLTYSSTTFNQRSFGEVIERFFEAEYLDSTEPTGLQRSSEESVPEQQDEFYTGIVDCENKTVFSILNGFWM